MTKQSLQIIKNDPWLKPYEKAIAGRHEAILNKISELTLQGDKSLSEFATGHLYFGLHRLDAGWVFREWAPNATKIYLIGNFSFWLEKDEFELTRKGDGVWEIYLPEDVLMHEDIYKLKIYWDGGEGERIPAWGNRVVQDTSTHIFSAQVWNPELPYQFQCTNFIPKNDPLLIYECHIGMAQEEEKVGTYQDFQKHILPRIAKAGYNCIQIMAVQEHPYYGSFGYHVSNFFAPSSRFGTPDELKELIDTAHSMGLAVIMDIVHSHAVKNEVEGLANFAGDPYQYFYTGERREHKLWDSLCFDYGKNEVLHFLLSNCKYWLDEFQFDGFRFDGVTSMLYYSHGMGEDFVNYDDYYNGHQDNNAITYLTLANELIHSVKEHAITIAEEVSGMPGLALPFKEGGYGFDYRMAMNIPDFWIKTIKERMDEDWKPSVMFWELTNRRADEKTISYVESHDQALVGDKTIIFRLIDSDMYWHMQKGDENYRVHRGMALHKMISLLTITTINGGYLNFMGNEFGHPEWIDFPREGNGWSYQYARRQWSLVDNKKLNFHYLADFNQEVLGVLNNHPGFQNRQIEEIWHDDGDQILAYKRGDLIFVFNFNPVQSFTDYGFLVPKGEYKVLVNTDSKSYGGFGFVDNSIIHHTNLDPLFQKEGKEWLKLYVPARTAMVLQKR